MERPNDLVVVPWYHEETYAEVLSIMNDADKLPERYEWWHRGAEEQVATLRRRGAPAASVDIDPHLFLNWCAEHDLLPNAEARLEYARELVGSRTAD